MNARTRGIVALAFAVGVGGCFHSDAHRSGVTEEGKLWSERVADEVSPQHIDALRNEILALGDPGEIDPGEAAILAQVAVRYGRALARQYRMVRPIEIHNALVNLGLRKRGLCYQTAEDMYVRFRAIELKTLRLHWGVAHRGDLWLEHSSVVVTAKHRPFSEGLVLDAWRHSGRLRWATVGGDRYPWVSMFKRKFPELRDVIGGQAASGSERAGPIYRIDSRLGEVRRGDSESAGAKMRPAAVIAPLPTPPSDSRTGGQWSRIVTTPPKPE